MASRVEPLQQSQEGRLGKRDATGGGRRLAALHMHEDGAAEVAHGGCAVILDHQPVPVQRLLQLLEGARRRLAAPHPAVVVGGLRVVHPEVLGAQLPVGKPTFERGRVAEGLTQREKSRRSAAVTLALFPGRRDAVSAEIRPHRRQRQFPAGSGALYCVHGPLGQGCGARVYIHELVARRGQRSHAIQAGAEAPRQLCRPDSIARPVIPTVARQRAPAVLAVARWQFLVEAGAYRSNLVRPIRAVLRQ